jgi:hypothetical protein
MKTIFPALIFVFFTACVLKTEKTRDFKIPKIIATKYSRGVFKTEKSLSFGFYDPLYMGKWKPAINLSAGFDTTTYFVKEQMRRTMIGDTPYTEYLYEYPKANELKIIVDNSYIITHRSSWIGDRFIDSTFYKCYPVILKNISDTTIQIGDGNFCRLEIDAKNQAGEWQTIEEHIRYECGNGLNGIILPKNEIAIFAAPIYTGNFKTKLRLRFYGSAVSNEFDGKINISQLK